MAKFSKKKLLIGAKIVITLLCFGLMFWYIGIDKLIDTFLNASWILLGIAFAMTPICLFVKTIRWYYLARSVDDSITYKDAVLSYLAGLCLAVITPFATGELARGCYFKDRAASTGKVFIDKLVDLTVVAIFTLAGVLFTVGYIQIKFISVAALIILITIWFIRKSFSRFCEFLSQRFKIAAIAKIGIAFAEIETKLLVKIFALAFLFFAMFYFQAFIILNAFFNQPPIATILFFPLITLSTIIPVTIGGLGIREWAAALLLKQFDIPEAVAVNTFFMHFILINFIPALIGAPFVHRLIRSKQTIEEK
ncbi:MAG: hypothetical protein DRI44_00535 [Chlamydiae bacterium]|nr:MAG: hypothetical protein DRI44_00535 [Chlamydiota bacterium]